MLPPPMARPTAAESSCPVAASVSFISAWRPPAKTCLSVAIDWTALRRRICGTMTEMDRMPGVAVLGVSDRHLEPHDTGCRRGDDLELLREFLLESAPEIGGQR